MALSRKEGTFTLFKEMYSACQKKINSYILKTSVQDINCVSYIWHIHFLGELYSKAMLDNMLLLRHLAFYTTYNHNFILTPLGDNVLLTTLWLPPFQ